MSVCKNCQQNFNISPQDREFYQRIQVPAPTLCPDCRQQRRLAWNNEICLYERKCDLSGEDIISMYPPSVQFPVYQTDLWWSDKWNPMKYGQDFDSSRSFFEQFNELITKVPRPSLYIVGGLERNLGSDYINYAGYCRSCYLIFNSDYSERCLYCYTATKSYDCVDCLEIRDCELCYQCIDCRNCYNLKYSQRSQNCHDCEWVYNCIGCSDCFACINLYRQEYCIFNKQYTAEEYQKKLREIKDKTTPQEIQNFFLKFPHRSYCGVKNENVSGDYLYHCRNSFNCYDAYETYNSRFCSVIPLGIKDSYDIYQYGENTELCYESAIIGYHTFNLKFCLQCTSGCRDLEYCQECHSSADLFACIGLRHQQFCIFNKQYTENEYFRLKEKIIAKMRQEEEYGEFFPIKYSPFGYNESMAQLYYPLNQDEATKKGYYWYERLVRPLDPALPVCSVCGKNFRLIPEESKFYQERKIPRPKKCFFCRHKERLALRNPRQLWSRQCAKCSVKIETTYSPDRPEIVYCPDCFKKEVY